MAGTVLSTRSSRSRRVSKVVHRMSPLLVGAAIASALIFWAVSANAAIVPTVPLGTSVNYSVLAGSTVTNTGGSILNRSLGLSPGSSVTGFPPATVTPPGVIDQTNAAAAQAQSDLTAAYVNAAGRPVSATTTADLANLNLQAGVYSGPSKSALLLNGPLTLDGAGDLSSVFIFQTDSTLTTGSASTVNLVNGAQECNVFWQIGSSATLGTGSVFAGNILALSSVTVTTGVTVHGRALARNGAVTLDNDVFTSPTCAQAPPTSTTAPPTTATPTTSTPPVTSPPASTPPASVPPSSVPPTSVSPPTSGPGLPPTGSSSGVLVWVASMLIVAGADSLFTARVLARSREDA